MRSVLSHSIEVPIWNELTQQVYLSQIALVLATVSAQIRDSLLTDANLMTPSPVRSVAMIALDSWAGPHVLSP